MHFQPTYRVHVADPLDFQESPFIVTTAYTNAGGYPKGEWFLVIPEVDGKLIAQRTRLSSTDFPEGLVAFDAEFLLNELLAQAKLRLRRYIFETKGNDALSLLARRLDTLPSNANLFVNFWMRGVFGECLNEIRSKTECEPLSSFLLWVLELPKLDTKDL